MRAFWSLLLLLAAIGVWFAFSTPADRPRTAPIDAPIDDTTPTTATPTTPSTPRQPLAVADPAPATAPVSDLLGEQLTAALFPSSAPNAPARPPVATDTRSPADITRRIDARTLELDGRFRIIGNGSPDDPYRISWELLTSASTFVDPEQKALTPPPWVRALEGSYIEISAYYSTALRVPTTKHLLLTFNRWDGCCIGLPPTAFDAIDTTLAAALDMRGEHLFRYGTFRGRLVVEPFMAGTYLLGLYRLEDASFVIR